MQQFGIVEHSWKHHLRIYVQVFFSTRTKILTCQRAIQDPAHALSRNRAAACRRFQAVAHDADHIIWKHATPLSRPAPKDGSRPQWRPTPSPLGTHAERLRVDLLLGATAASNRARFLVVAGSWISVVADWSAQPGISMPRTSHDSIM